MLTQAKKTALALIFGITATAGMGIAFNGAAQAETDIRYKKLKKAGVKIPIREHKRINDNTLTFKIYREDVNKWDYVWSVIRGKDFGFYMDGINPKDKKQLCPYIGEKDDLPGTDIADTDQDEYIVTLILEKPLIDRLIEVGCAVSAKPRRAPDPDNNNKGGEQSNPFLFPMTHQHHMR